MEVLSSSKLWQIFDASAQIVGELPSPSLGLWENQLRLICWSRAKKRGREPQEWLAEQSRSRQLFVGDHLGRLRGWRMATAFRRVTLVTARAASEWAAHWCTRSLVVLFENDLIQVVISTAWHLARECTGTLGYTASDIRHSLIHQSLMHLPTHPPIHSVSLYTH